jgi:membrane protein implicated in regulation of membrane protease activity
MTNSHTPTRAGRRASLSTFVGGLSAWLGGVAFCVGFGVSAPAWMALVLTVLSVAAAGLSRRVVRRSRA